MQGVQRLQQLFVVIAPSLPKICSHAMKDASEAAAVIAHTDSLQTPATQLDAIFRMCSVLLCTVGTYLLDFCAFLTWLALAGSDSDAVGGALKR